MNKKSFSFPSVITKYYVVSAAIAFVVGGFFIANSVQAFTSPTAPNLGAAGNYVILSQSGISNTGTTAITGDIGVSPIAHTAITGFALTPETPNGTNTFSTSALVNGQVFASNYSSPTPANLSTAIGAIGTAITAANGRAVNDTNLTFSANVGCSAGISGGTCDLSGLILAPGVYAFTGPGNVTITGDVTLNGGANDVWIFQIPGTLNISSTKKVLLTGGAVPANVFWSVAGATTLGTNSTFKGNILDQTDIAMQTGATLIGRALAQTAVTLDSNTVSANAPAATCTTTCYADVANGHDTNGGTSISDAKKTIQAAIDQVSADGTVNVASGTYTESLSLDKAVNLAGNGTSTTIIKPSIVGGAVITVDVVTGPMTISGFTIDANNNANESGIYIEHGSRNITFEQNDIKNFTDRGIVINNSNSNTIRNNNLTGVSGNINSGVYVDNESENNSIDGNTIGLPTSGTGTLYGVLFTGPNSKNNTVENNTINGGKRAFQQDTSVSGTTTFSNNIIGNITSSSYAGIKFDGGSAIISGNTLTNAVRPIEIQGAVNLTISNNIIDGATYSGINLISYSGTANISGNTIHGIVNNNGIWAQAGGSGLNITNNIIYDISKTPERTDYPGRGIQINMAAKNANIDGNEIYNVTGFAGIVIDGTPTDGATGAKINNNYIYNSFQGMAVNEQTVEFKNNRVLNNGYGIDLNKEGATFVLVNNSIADNNTQSDSYDLGMWQVGTADATSTYWGAESPDFAKIIAGATSSVSYDPWYINPGKTVLSSDIQNIFTGISTTLAGQGIVSNIGSSTVSNYKVFPGLYFEKSISGQKVGKITFNSALDLSSATTTAFLQHLGSQMEAGQGIIGLDFTGYDPSLKGVSADIKFYGLDILFPSGTTADEINNKLIAFNDDGTLVANKTSLIPLAGTYDAASHAFTINVNHFTKYEIDNTPPVITLNGSATTTIEAGSAYTEQGANWTDNVDGSGTVTNISGTVNNNIPGTYTVTYGKIDAVGNSATATRAVVVQDTTAPTITLLGDNNVKIYKGTSYTDAGATASDIVDGSVSVNNDSGSVDTNTVGVYTITYSAHDAAGNATTTTRTVEVLAVAETQKVLSSGSTTALSSSTSEVMIGDNAPATSTISVPSGVTNASLNVSALVLGTSTKSAVLSGEITVDAVTSVGDVKVEIPSGINITGDSTWDGTINLPQVKLNSSVTVVPNLGNNASVSSVIEVGFGDVKLTFDKAVRILIAGQAGKYVGYSRGGVFTTITDVCSADTQAAGDALSPEENCKINVDSDLVIWTKHFTSFITYTQTAKPGVGGGNGGGGGGGGAPAAVTTPAVTAPAAVVNAPAITVPAASVVATPAGQVLGASTFNFTSDLRLGAKEDAVTELQNRLTAEGVYSGPITGYFGPLTLAGVKAYQGKYGISQVGNVGPLTRAQLNGSKVAGASTVNTEAVKVQLTSLQAQLIILLQQLQGILQAQVK